jgi:tetratricopeptide (TPR) repeat protein
VLFDTTLDPIALDVDEFFGMQVVDGFSTSAALSSSAKSKSASATSSNPRRTVRKKYQRKRGIPETEEQQQQLRQKRQEEYEQIMRRGKPNLWFFEKLFPEPVWDDATIQRDLYEIKNRDDKVAAKKQNSTAQTSLQQAPNQLFRQLYKMKSASLGGNSMMRVWRQPKLSQDLPYDPPPPPIFNMFKEIEEVESPAKAIEKETNPITSFRRSGQDLLFDSPSSPANKLEIIDEVLKDMANPIEKETNPILSFRQSITQALAAATTTSANATSAKVDLGMTRLVEDRVYGIRRTRAGGVEYETSLLGSDEAVKFREGVRLSNPLGVNADRLNYFAKKELGHGRVEEAQELYEKAIQLDPRDGRAYLGLSRCAQRRRDFLLARDCLRAGLANSVTVNEEGYPDRGANPYLLQALGCLEEQRGLLSEAESLYIAAARSRPSHAASWVALAQLRTRKLGQGAAAGRVCFQSAERELSLAGLPPSAYVYTAWASMEYKKASDPRRARELYQLALQADPKCSAAWLQLGMMEADLERWEKAQECFEAVLKFDQRNSRVLQAYAIMETRRPDANSRKAIDLFERALKVKPRDAAVLQAYALYVVKLGDVKSARDL